MNPETTHTFLESCARMLQDHACEKAASEVLLARKHVPCVPIYPHAPRRLQDPLLDLVVHDEGFQAALQDYHHNGGSSARVASAALKAQHQAKVGRLLDLLRRATANGTHQEVAEAIAIDWSPLISFNKDGEISIELDA